MWLTVILTLLFVGFRCDPDEEQGSCSINSDGTTNCKPDETPFGMDYVQYLRTNNPQVDFTNNLLSQKDFENNDCENQEKWGDRQCNDWYNRGECEKSPTFMIFNCPKACGYCHLLDEKTRCSRHPDQLPAVYPGDVNRMFRRAISEFPQYSPEILSSPPNPWVVVFNNVVSDEEAEQLIKLGGKNFKRSVDAGKMSEDGSAQFESVISDARTSETDWCVYGCWDDEIIHRIVEKVEEITLIPRENSEFFQVLKYEVGQYYVEHHDYIHGHLDLPIGSRVYTAFLYLNDVEEGGGTKFNKLNITVTPKKGSLLLWPSVLNEDPTRKDFRMHHEALPPTKGRKYGANLWLHMFNFHSPYRLLCTG